MVHPDMRETFYTVEPSLREYRHSDCLKLQVYCIRYGSRKIAEVWFSGTIRKFYRHGKLSPEHGIPKSPLSTSGWAVSYIILRDAFDEKTANDWYMRVECVQHGYLKTINTKADLFDGILAARHAVPLPAGVQA